MHMHRKSRRYFFLVLFFLLSERMALWPQPNSGRPPTIDLGGKTADKAAGISGADIPVICRAYLYPVRLVVPASLEQPDTSVRSVRHSKSHPSCMKASPYNRTPCLLQRGKTCFTAIWIPENRRCTT
ncbi:hypothetical protein F5Y12DRAFT_734204 [Xylaria sp. FL1777]|nr:hypothetical protein F5Y12DRAFT_734204 [Xylaria sp. FL1777]